MGGFTDFFDRPPPHTTMLVKNPAMQHDLDALNSDYRQGRAATQQGLGDYISKYLAGTAAAERQTGQESDAIDQFYNGGMDSRLSQLRAQRRQAMTDAANRGSAYAIRGINLNRLGNEGGGSSYDTRQAIRNVTDIQTQAALDDANQERQDFGYLTGNRIGLAGARTGLADRLAQRSLVPGQVRSQVLGQNAGDMGRLLQLDQANKFYGIKQDPGILDRLRQDQQFVQGLGSMMQSQYNTAGTAAYGWSGMAGGGAGAGGGGMGMSGMSRGGEVHGPGTETSDSIPARLSEGEFVVPAAAVRMPGVLPWLKHLRAKALALEGNRDLPLPGHYETGGLIYANDFGGLGAMAFNYDALNQHSQQTASAAGQQDRQFQEQLGLEQKKLQAEKDKKILDDYNKGSQQQPVGGGYMPESNFGTPISSPTFRYDQYARGGMVRGRYAEGGTVDGRCGRGYRWSEAENKCVPLSMWEQMFGSDEAVLNYGGDSSAGEGIGNDGMGGAYARGGMVLRYADGGVVKDIRDNPDMLHEMAKEAAYRMMQPGWRSSGQQQADSYDRQLRLQERGLNLQDRAQKRLEETPTPSQERGHEMLFLNAMNEADQGNQVDTKSLNPDEANLVASRFKRGQQARQMQYDAGQGDAKILNRVKDLTSYVAQSKKFLESGGDKTSLMKYWPADTEAMKNARQSLSDYQDELAELRPQAANILETNKKTGHLAPNPKTGQWMSTISPPLDQSQPSRSGIGYVAPLAAPTAGTNAASLYKAGSRYGKLRYLGGDPNDERSWQPVQ